MADLEFKIAKRSTEPIPFSLIPAEDGAEPDKYVFTPPKQAMMILSMLDSVGDPGEEGLGATRAMFDWLSEGLSTEENDRLIGRLKDPADDLDIDSLGDIIKGILSVVSGRPTT